MGFSFFNIVDQSPTFDVRTFQTPGFVSEMPGFPLVTSMGMTKPPFIPDTQLFDTKAWQLFDYQNTPVGPRESEVEKRKESIRLAEMMGQEPNKKPFSTILHETVNTGANIASAVGTLFDEYNRRFTNVDNAKPRAGYPDGRDVVHHDVGPQLRGQIPASGTDTISGIPKQQQKGLFNLGFIGPLPQEGNTIKTVVSDNMPMAIITLAILLGVFRKRGN